jgi:hypothetical protein
MTSVVESACTSTVPERSEQGVAVSWLSVERGACMCRPGERGERVLTVVLRGTPHALRTPSVVVSWALCQLGVLARWLSVGAFVCWARGVSPSADHIGRGLEPTRDDAPARAPSPAAAPCAPPSSACELHACTGSATRDDTGRSRGACERERAARAPSTGGSMIWAFSARWCTSEIAATARHPRHPGLIPC